MIATIDPRPICMRFAHVVAACAFVAAVDLARADALAPVGSADGGVAAFKEAAAVVWTPALLPNAQSHVVAHASKSGVAMAIVGPPPLVFTTTDGGASWRQSAEWPLSGGSKQGVSDGFVGGTPTVMYAQLEARPLQSPDEGRTWHPIDYVQPPPFGPDHTLAAVNPASVREKVVFSGTSVAVTSDNGAHWRVDSSPGTITGMTVDWSTRRMYAALLNGFAGKSLDAPGSWSTPADYDGNALLPYAAAGGVVLLNGFRLDGGAGNRLVRSTDGGVTFQQVGQEVDASILCDIAFAPSRPNVVYALACLDGFRLLRSNDAGATWQESPVAIYGGGTLAVDGSDPHVVWIGAFDGIYKSVDGGISFARIERSTGAPGAGNAVFFDAADPLRIYAHSPVGRLISDDGGGTWQMAVKSQANPYSIVWGSRSRPGVVLGQGGDWFYGGHHCELAVSHDGSSTFAPVLGCTGPEDAYPELVLIDGPRSGEVFVFLRREGGTDVHASIDDADSWTLAGTLPGLTPASAAASCPSSAILYLGVHASATEIGLYRSVDGGKSWNPVAELPIHGTVSAIAVDPTDANRVYAGFGDSSSYPLLRSSDGGATWDRAGAGLGTGAIASIAIDPTHAGTLYAVQAGSGVFRSVDHGATWNAMDDGLRGAESGVLGIRISPRAASVLNLWTSGGNFVTDVAAGAPAGSQRAIEFYHQDFNHYFVSSNMDEVAGLDAGVFHGWARTGEGFRVGIPDARGRGYVGVCRFFGVGFAPLSSHFFTPYPSECDIVKADPNWLYEKIAFGLALPDAVTHGCPLGARPLYRLWNHNLDGAPNHRYTTSTLAFDEMIGQGWIFEGEKETRVFACVPN